MKKTSILLLLLSFANLTFAQNQQSIESIATYLTITGKYGYAAEIYEHLMETQEPTASLYNTIGTNQLKQVFDMLPEKMAEDKIRFIFPFEVSANGNTKGDPIAHLNKMMEILQISMQNFQSALEIEAKNASVHLNYACAASLLGRLEEDNQRLYAEAVKYARKAAQFAGQQDLPDTQANAEIVLGILYDYMGLPNRRDQQFAKAATGSNSRVQRLTENNLRMLKGEKPVKTSGEKWSIFEDEEERVAGKTIEQVNYQLKYEGLKPDEVIMTYKPGEALYASNLYIKHYPEAELYIYEKGEQASIFYVYLFQTSNQYDSPTEKGIQIGDRSQKVYEEYGTPAYIQPARGGRFLHYKEADILFFVNAQDRVDHWVIWGESMDKRY